MSHQPSSRITWITGEFLGTFLMVFFGCGSVAAAVTTGAQVGVFQVAIVWGIAIATAIYVCGSLSGAHLNPAVTLSMSVWGGFPKSRVLPYILVQLAAAFFAAWVLYLIFGSAISQFESLNGIVRGQHGSESSAMIFGEFFPNPGGRALGDPERMRMPHGGAIFAEFIGTAILVLVIHAVVDEKNRTQPGILTALTIGLTVTILISLLAPLTMAGFNPARDLGPRLFSSLAGWGSVPFTTNGIGWLTVYILAPMAGGLLGGGIYTLFLKPAYAQHR